MDIRDGLDGWPGAVDDPCMGARGRKTGLTMQAGGFAARLLLFALALRALAPPGFMPDLQALQQGRFEVVICTGTGMHMVAVDADGQPLPDADDGTQGSGGDRADCVFRGLVAAALLPADTALATLAPPARQPAGTLADEVLPPPPLGPPLGARAPPRIPG